jgi:NAD(P)-dependent dehydrogenase (short-subunit alcohol dehydrogenase family)
VEMERTWCVLVGGRRRLGRALAEDLARDHDLVLTSGRPWGSDSPWIKELAERTQVRTFCWDAEDSGLVPQMMADLEGLRAEGLQLATAVLLAGVFPEHPLGTWGGDDLQALWRVNLTFPLLVSQALAPALAEGGSLQLVLDTCIHRPFLRRLPYSASKAALAALVPGLARALSPRLRVVGHALGILLPAEGDPEIPPRSLLRAHGVPADLARAVRYASQSPYLTGEILTLDGGTRWA